MIVKLLLVVLLAQLCENFAIEDSYQLLCEDVKKGSTLAKVLFFVGKFMSPDSFSVNFYVSTQKHRKHTLVDVNDITSLNNTGFDPFLKTIIIIHGYKSGGTKKWVIKLKNGLLNAVSMFEYFISFLYYHNNNFQVRDHCLEISTDE